MQRELVIGGFYRHFKNKLYQVRGVAIHSETKEKMVLLKILVPSPLPTTILLTEYQMPLKPLVIQRWN